MSDLYGLPNAIADVVGGYEGEMERQKKEAQQADVNEMNRLKLDSAKKKAEQEGLADAVKSILMGDLTGAEERYNSVGEDRVSNIEYDPESGLVSFTDKEGNQRDVMIQHMMAVAGINPATLDTPDAKLQREKDLYSYKLQEKAKYGGEENTNQSAYVQNLNFLMKYFTNGKKREAIELYQMSKSDPRQAFVRIYSDLQKANSQRRRSQQKSDDELRKEAYEITDKLNRSVYDRLLGPSEQQGQPAQQSYGLPSDNVTENPSVFNQGDNDPLSIL